jgi:SAM-dependent methyltransferase
MKAADRWAEALAARAIPQPIIDAAPTSPWGFPTELFRTRARMSSARPVATPTTVRGLEALPASGPPSGTVLDVGVGGGATSLPLAPRAGRITGFDQQADMLAIFLEAAGGARVDAEAVQGRWPDDEGTAPRADVVISGHTLYNVPDLVPFVSALDAHAGRRVVLEATERHPLGWMRDLWRRFHDLDIPDAPSIDLAVEVIEAKGIAVSREDRPDRDDDPGAGGFDAAEDAVALIRTRLCLPASRDAELTEALGDRLRVRHGLWTAGPASRTVVTLWWDTHHDESS